MAVVALPRRGLRVSRPAARRTILGHLFVAPWLIGFLAFSLYPIAMSFYYSFTHYDILTAPRWTGLSNYQSLLLDHVFWTAVYNTVYLTVLGVPLNILLGLALALLVNQKVRGIGLYRACIFLP